MSSTSSSIIILASFLIPFILILILLWWLIRKINIPHRSRTIVYAIMMVIVSVVMVTITDQILKIFEYFGIIDKNHIILNVAKDAVPIDVDKMLKGIFTAVSLLLSAYIVNSLLNYFIWEGTLVDEEDGTPLVPKLIRNLVALIFYAIGFVIAIAIEFPHVLSHALVGMGTSGAVTAFLAKEPIQKAFTALSLNINKLLKKGDIIQVAGVKGRIQEIGWSSVKLLTADRNLIVIPNNHLTKNTITNLSRPEENLAILINVSASSNIMHSRMLPLLRRSAQDAELVKVDSEPLVYVRSIGKHLTYYTIEVESEEPKHEIVRSQVLKAVLNMFRREGITEVPEEYLVKNAVAKAQNLLKQIKIFEDLTEEENLLLAQKASWLRYGYPERVVIQNEKEASLYIIAEGSLEVLVNSEDNQKDDTLANSHLKVAMLEKYDIFGEMALLTGEKRNATIRAKTDTLLCKISKENIKTILEKNPDILEYMSSKLASRQTEIEKTKGAHDIKLLQQQEVKAKTSILNLALNFFKEETDIRTEKNRNKEMY